MRPRPRAHTKCDTATLNNHEKVLAPTTGTESQPDLLILSCVEDLAYLLRTHTPADFASLANKYTNATGSTVVDSSAAALITPDIVQHYVHGSWQGTMQVQNFLSGIFRLPGIDPSISLFQQKEIYQMFCLWEAPQRWTRSRHFSTRASYEELSGLPLCCGPWHNGSNHFVPFYLCPEYCTILDPLNPARDSYPTQETHLHSAITESYVTRGPPPPSPHTRRCT